MSDSDIRAWLVLLRAPATRLRMRLALEAAGTAEAVLAQGDRTLAKLGFDEEARRWLANPDAARIDADLAWLDQPDRHLITPAHPDWPPLLTEIPDPPIALFVRGDPALLAEPQLAIVGSRNPTHAGREIAADFASHLARAGLVITSGLALGIDGAAHRGALDSGGATIAVCGTGLDRIYPARHRTLGRDIVAHGAIVSEYPPGTRPLRHHFPERNRLVSGMSLGVLVVEAAQRSGSLISARLASEQGREVFAIPGSIHNPLAHGCHRLIRDGAKLVETAADVLEELAPLLGLADRREDAADNASGAAGSPILNYVDFAPTSVDCVVERSGLTPAAVSAMLLSLELQGSIAAAPGGGYMRTSTSGSLVTDQED
ncbi:MAG TPA: DNA-processing protein DprA [Gammaproteobacteria bacterium]|nr:DNA-processing protein DprA [Gammaproteobacteria bacterium]